MKHQSVFWLVSFSLAAATAQADWLCAGGDAAHHSTARQAPADFSEIAWTAVPLSDEKFIASASPVASGGRVFIAARRYSGASQTGNRLIAFDAHTGARLWHYNLPSDSLNSWSSPAIDKRNSVVIVATASLVTALNMADGSPRWLAPLPAAAVNASPVVSDGLTQGGAPANRMFITTFAPFATGQLVAMNVDPYSAANNPFLPGQVAWSAPLNDVSGSTVAVAGGIAVVATAEGALLAFDARTGGAPLWTTSASISGFFGGVTVRGGHVYAATYDFWGASELVRLDLETGALDWSIACDRSDATPVVTADGHIFLSAGIDGFGSTPRVQAFEDLEAYAVQLWDTAGALRVGCWNHQPLYSDGFLLVGEAPITDWAPYVRLRMLDTTLAPTAPGFVVDTLEGAGGSPAIDRDRLYSVGVAGLMAVRLVPHEEPVWRTGKSSAGPQLELPDSLIEPMHDQR